MDNISESYKSPIRLIKYAGESFDEFSQRSVMQTKKMLLAELALQGDELVVDDIAYSKNDINSLLNDLNEINWKYHCLIFINDAMLNFLEKQQFDKNGFQLVEHLLKEYGFVDFVSPYFAWSFNEVSGKLIRDYDQNILPAVMAQQKFMLSIHEETAYRKIRVYFADLLYTLRNLSWEKFRENEGVLFFVFSSSWITAVNELPFSFDDSRNELAEQMLGIVYRFQRKATWQYLYEVCLKLKALNCSSEWKTHINEYIAIMGDNAKRTGGRVVNTDTGSGSSTNRSTSSSTSSSGGGGWKWGFGGIWVIIALFRLLSNGGCGSSYSGYNERSYGDMGTSMKVVSDMINNSRTSKENYGSFINALDELSQQDVSGKPKKITTGDVPFENITTLPYLSGDVSVTVSNETGKDALLIYQSAGYNILSPSDKIMAVFIKNGEKYELDMSISKSSYLNFAFGNNWVRKKNITSFDLKRYYHKDGYKEFDSSKIETMFLDGFFRQPLNDQVLLHNNIELSYASSEYGTKTSDDEQILYSPQRENSSTYDKNTSTDKGTGTVTPDEEVVEVVEDAKVGTVDSYGPSYKAQLILRSEGNTISVKGSGDCFIKMVKRTRITTW